MHGAVAVINGFGPVFRHLGIEHIVGNIVVRFAGGRIIGIGLSVGKLDIEEHKLVVCRSFFGKLCDERKRSENEQDQNEFFHGVFVEMKE